MLNKRLIILIAIITGIVIFAGLILWLLFKTPTAEQPPVTEQPIEEEITTPITPSGEEEKLTVFKLSDVAAISPAISGNKVLYYSKLNGNVYETDFEGKNTTTKTNINIPDLITTVWSYDKSKAINIYKENDVVKKVLFDFVTQKAVQLDSRMNWVTFAPNKDKIAYQFVDRQLGTNKIATADPNGLNFQSIFPVRMENIRVYWPTENAVTFSLPPSGLTPGAVFIKTISDQSAGLTKLIDNVNGLTIKYSPDGARLLYSKTDSFGHSPELNLISANGVTANLNINTLSDKCAFSQANNIYCAVPRLINGSLILPDDFYKNTANFSDIFFKIDATNNRSTALLDPADLGYDFNAADIQVSPSEDYIVFVNKKDGLLYSIKIR